MRADEIVAPHDMGGYAAVDPGRLHAQRDRRPEATIVARAYSDAGLGGYVRWHGAELLRPRREVHRTEIAGSTADREKLLPHHSESGAAEFLGACHRHCKYARRQLRKAVAPATSRLRLGGILLVDRQFLILDFGWPERVAHDGCRQTGVPP